MSACSTRRACSNLALMSAITWSRNRNMRLKMEPKAMVTIHMRVTRRDFRSDLSSSQGCMVVIGFGTGPSGVALDVVIRSRDAETPDEG